SQTEFRPLPLTDQCSMSHQPDWSFDGTRIAFNGMCNDAAGLYSIAPDGTGLTLIIDEGEYPRWSSDDTQVFYTMPKPTSNSTFQIVPTDLKVMGLQSNPTPQILTTKIQGRGGVTIQPEAQSFFAHHGKYLRRISVQTPDAIENIQASVYFAPHTQLDWLPQSGRIAFLGTDIIGDRDTRYILYSMLPDGTELVRHSIDMDVVAFDWHRDPRRK
ncbi:MAG: hypothetical protein H7Y11_14795, partial [Armatimonadetes bacterium]|nr:hypothetical protein [Anaerolineae bacterium]